MAGGANQPNGISLPWLHSQEVFEMGPPLLHTSSAVSISSKLVCLNTYTYRHTFYSQQKTDSKGGLFGAHSPILSQFTHPFLPFLHSTASTLPHISHAGEYVEVAEMAQRSPLHSDAP